MLKTFAAIGLGAAVALTPLAAPAQNAPPPSTSHHQAAHKSTGSYRSEMRKRHGSSKDRARAGAEHMRMMHSQ